MRYPQKYSKKYKATSLTTSGNQSTSPSIKIQILLLLFIMGIGILLSIYFYAGPDMFYDDSTYLYLAHTVNLGETNFIVDLFAYSFMKVVLLAFALKLFGVGAFQAITVTITEYLITILIVFLIARKLMGPYFALLASLIISVQPTILAFSTRLIPNMGIGMIIGLSIYLYIVSSESKKLYRYILFFLFGFATGATIYMNDEGFAFVGIAALSFIAIMVYDYMHKTSYSKNVKNQFRLRFGNKLNAKVAVSAAMGLITAVALYFLVWYLLVGMPFFIFSHYAGMNAMPLSSILLSVFYPFGSNFASIDLFPVGLIIYFAIAGTIFSLIKSNRNRYINYISAICWFMLLYLLIGSYSLSSYDRIPFSIRFIIDVLVPLSILSTYALSKVYLFIIRKFSITIGYTVVIALVTILILTNIGTYYVIKNSNTMIANQRSLMYSAVNYILSLTPSGKVEIYEANTKGFNIVTFQDILFIAKYNPNVNASMTQLNYVKYSYNTPSCNLNSNSPSSYMFIIAEPNTYSLLLNNTNVWLGSNCTMTQLKTFNSSALEILIYRINAKLS